MEKWWTDMESKQMATIMVQQMEQMGLLMDTDMDFPLSLDSKGDKLKY